MTGGNRLRTGLSTAAIIAVVLGTLGWTLAGLGWARDISSAALLVYVALEAPKTAKGSRIMLSMGVLMSLAALVWSPAPAALLTRALNEASFLIGLFASLSLLRDAAESSPLIQRCGETMVRQPPGRRFLVLSIGSHLISLVLNFGSLSLLGTMVLKGNTLEAAGGDARIAAIRQQRMMTAVLRGFALMTVWSPLSVSFAVTQAVVHGVPWWRLLSIQVVLATLLMGLGWLMDRRAFPPHPGTPAPVGDEPSWRPLGDLCLLVAAVVVASVAVAEVLGVRLVVGAMVVVPPASIVWLTVQHWHAGPLSAFSLALSRFAGRLTVSLPAFRNEVAMIGGAMYAGILAASFVPPEATAQAIAALHLPPVLLTIVLAWSVMLLAQLGVSQIVSVTLLGGALANLTHLGIQPLILASGLMAAWALSACSTIVGAAVLTVARLSDVETRTVARGWNGRFVLAGALLLALWMMGLSLLV
jgi:hypothetical protein